MQLMEARRYAQRLREHELLTVCVGREPKHGFVLSVLRPGETELRVLRTRQEVQDALMGRWS